MENVQKKTTLIKISKKTPLNTRSKSCNTDLSFNPFDKVVFSIESDPVVSTAVKDFDQLSDSFFETPEKQQDIEQGDTSFFTDSESEKTESDEESGDNEENVSIGDPISEPKFIVFWSCLVTLFTFCRKCLQSCVVDKVTFKGTLLSIKTTCVNNHEMI